MKKVMVFGVFDGVHEGHRAFLRGAKALGNYLIAVVAQDEVVERLKGRRPRRNFAERAAHVEKEDGVDEVVAGDVRLGTYAALKAHRPAIVAVGYDQRALKADLESRRASFGWKFEIAVMPAHRPKEFHSSILENGAADSK